MAAVFKAQDHVQEIASPHRKGYVRAVAGTGPNAQVVVNLTGWHPVTFKPAQLRKI